MSTSTPTRKPRVKAGIHNDEPHNVIQFPVTSAQVDRFTAALEGFNTNFAQFNTNIAYMSEKVGSFANDFTKLVRFGTKYLPWIIAAGAVVFPNLKPILDYFTAHPLPPIGQ